MSDWMKVYFVSAGEVTEYDYYQREPPETYVLVEIVAARSRRAATYQMWKKHQRVLGDLTDQRWETKQIGEAWGPAVLEWNHSLWSSPLLPEPCDLRDALARSYVSESYDR